MDNNYDTMNLNLSSNQPGHNLDSASLSTRQAVVEMRSKRKAHKKCAYLGADILRTKNTYRDRALNMADQNQSFVSPSQAVEMQYL